jgi:probable O-glycosylation ligase (exosortase A-associated)
VREIFLIVIVILLSAIALVRPKIGLYAYVWFTLMRPDYFAWSTTGVFPYVPVLSIATALGSLRHFADFGILLRNPIARLLILLQIPVAVSVISAVYPSLAYEPFWAFERLIPITLLIPVLIRSEEDLRGLILVMACSLGAIGLKFGLFGLRAGGVHLYEGYAGLDNNSLAAQLAMTVPLLWYGRSLLHSKWFRLVFIGVIFTCVTAVVMTQSRGGSLALLTALLLLVYRSRHKVAVMVLFGMLAVPPIYMYHQAFFARMDTLRDPTQEVSANSRLVMAEAAFQMWKSYPLIGVGFGNENFIALQRPYIEDSRFWGLKVHNGYLQMLVDCGLFGFIPWVWLLFGTIARLWRSAGVHRRAQSALEAYPRGLAIGLIVFAQYNLSGGKERDSILYIFLMCAAAWLTVARSLPEQPADTEVPALEEGTVLS